MKKIIFIIPIIFIIIVLYWQRKSPEKVHIHYHAGFVVFKDNQKVDFSNDKYMEIQNCSLDEKIEQTPEEIQIEKAHLHDHVGDVVHVHQNGAVWGDIFTNLDYQLEKDFQAYVDGEKIDNFLEYPIKAYDSVVIVEGGVDDVSDFLAQSVTRSHIEEVEKKSESCGK